MVIDLFFEKYIFTGANQMTTNITKRYLKGEIPLKHSSYITIVKENEEYSVIFNVAFVTQNNTMDEIPLKFSESEIQELFSKIHDKIQSDYVKKEIELYQEEYTEFLNLLAETIPGE